MTIAEVDLRGDFGYTNINPSERIRDSHYVLSRMRGVEVER